MLPVSRRLALALPVALSFAQPVAAQVANSDAPSADDIAKQRQLIAAQEQQLQRQQKMLEAQQAQLDAMKKQLDALAPRRTVTAQNTPAAPGATNDPSVAIKTNDPTPPPKEVGTDRKELNHEKMPEITVLDDQAGVLLQKGKVILEPGVQYSNASNTSVAIEGFTIIPALNIGSFQVSDVNRDIVTAQMTGRVGVTNRLELDATVPYVHRNDSTNGRPFGTGSSTNTLTSTDGNDIGDVEVGAHYQINNNTDGWPIFIANGRFKTTTGTGPFDVPVSPTTGLQTKLPTGSGFYAFEPSVAAIYPSDPAVFFANAGYIFNFDRSFANVGRIDPGNAVDLGLGTSLALNDRASLSFSYNHQVVDSMTQNGNTIPGSRTLQIGTLNIGGAYKLYDNVSLDFIVSAGVTHDAPNDQILFKVPISFDLF